MEQLTELLARFTLPTQILIVLIGSVTTAKVIELTGRWVAPAVESTTGSIHHIILREIYVPLYLSVFLYGLFLSLELIGAPILSFFEAIVLSAIIVLWTRAGIQAGSKSLKEIKEHDNHYEFAPVFKNLWSAAVAIVAGIALLLVWNIDITPLLASAGVFGIILGFAAQDAIANFVGGIALYFDDTYKIGDFIVLESGEKGSVTNIGIRSTTVLTPDRVMITIPNSVLNSAQLRNESAPQRQKRIRIPIEVAYGTSTKIVEEILLSVAADSNGVLSSPRPTVLFQEFGESALRYELQIFISHPLREPRIVDEVNRAIQRRFTEEGIEIPFPQREISLRSDDDDTSAGDERQHLYSEFESK
ncbi:mechanosensitive ion channel family protein [Halalkalicoccus tibetensis]|uniref:Mechanosensitive ion channel family protein n=1 Tax=Halalkalicoccus tibetensis TaxID=175632 RepID=A0ABD5VB16_9EURY